MATRKMGGQKLSLAAAFVLLPLGKLHAVELTIRSVPELARPATGLGATPTATWSFGLQVQAIPIAPVTPVPETNAPASPAAVEGEVRAVDPLNMGAQGSAALRNGGDPGIGAVVLNAAFDGTARQADAPSWEPALLGGASGGAHTRLAPSELDRKAAAPPAPANGFISFMTDFGELDPSPGICKLVMVGVGSALQGILDLTHLVPKFNVRLGADFLAAAIPHAKAGTTIVAVVDPGVGGARRSIAIRTRKGHLLVGPDNGLLVKAAELIGIDKIVQITNPDYLYIPFEHSTDVSATFHARDVYSPVGAHLASGVPIENLGPELHELTRLEDRPTRMENGVIYGEVAYVEDPFGSVLTNIPRALIDKAGWKPGTGLKLEVRIGRKTVILPYEKTFSDVPVGDPLALFHSREVFSFSINQGHFGNAHGVNEGDPVVVRLVDPG